MQNKWGFTLRTTDWTLDFENSFLAETQSIVIEVQSRLLLILLRVEMSLPVGVQPL